MQRDIDAFNAARAFLLNARSYDEAKSGFRWPDLIRFNWALDYFDRMARDNTKTALIYLDESNQETRFSFDEMRRRSNQTAHFLQDAGVKKGDVVLVMLHNTVELFDVLLGAMKISAVLCPASVLLTHNDLEDRISRGKVKAIIADHEGVAKIEQAGEAVRSARIRIVVGAAQSGWTPLSNALEYPDEFTTPFPTFSTDPCLLYFTSGTTAEPKLVLHTHSSYPVGHLVTMYWLGVREGDVHYNISAPGWAKHAWSNFFAPWNAGATVFVRNYARFNARKALKALEFYKVATLCAPPTVWRLFLIEDLRAYHFSLRELVSAGEPLNPEVIRCVYDATGLRIREGYGQTETVLQAGVFPGMETRAGKLGVPAPGFDVRVVDSNLLPAANGAEGQIAVRVAPARPVGIMKGYLDDPARMDEVFIGGWYLSGDVGVVDDDGYISFIGRNDDVFKSSDYRISPFEIESLLLQHPAVAEAGVVGSMDHDRGGLVPKAFLALKPGYEPSRALALDLFRFSRHTIAPYKRIRRLEFMPEIVKTVSGKIRRAELRLYDLRLRENGERGKQEFMESEFAAEMDRFPRQVVPKPA